MKKELLMESHFIDMDDDALKEHLGYLWESCKRLKDQMKTDPEIERMTRELKTYKDDNFNVQIKRYTKLLKAARMVASGRGIQWKVPEL